MIPPRQAIAAGMRAHWQDPTVRARRRDATRHRRIERRKERMVAALEARGATPEEIARCI